jgi:hypothetical protein
MLAEIYMSYFIGIKKKRVCLEQSFQQHIGLLVPIVRSFLSVIIRSVVNIHREPFFHQIIIILGLGLLKILMW